MELEFIRVVAEEKLANMDYSSDIGDLFTVWCCCSTTERQILLHFAFSFFLYRRTAHVSFSKRISPWRPHCHLLVSFEQSVPSGSKESTMDGVCFLRQSLGVYLLLHLYFFPELRGNQRLDESICFLHVDNTELQVHRPLREQFSNLSKALIV